MSTKSAAGGRALVAQLGTGSEDRRRALARILGRRAQSPALVLDALGQPDLDSPRRSDLLNALAHAPRAQDPSAIEAALVPLFSTDASYEEVYRLAQAALRHGGATIDQALSDLYRKHSQDDGPESIALRELILELGRGASHRARQIEALGDSDAAIRKAALRGLASSDDDAAHQAIASHLGTEAWPELRREATGGLQAHCKKAPVAEALLDRVLRDLDADVARTALVGLQKCEGKKLFPLLSELVDDDKRPLDLRLHAARSLGQGVTAAQAAAVVGRFQRFRRQALAKADAAQVASALTVSLADIGTPKAIEALERTAADPAFPQLQAAALSALAPACRASSKGLFRRLARSQDPGVSLAARRALSSCL
jgi:hypothetical protein